MYKLYKAKDDYDQTRQRIAVCVGFLDFMWRGHTIGLHNNNTCCLEEGSQIEWVCYVLVLDLVSRVCSHLLTTVTLNAPSSS